jgi:hypothetical protein
MQMRSDHDSGPGARRCKRENGGRIRKPSPPGPVVRVTVAQTSTRYYQLKVRVWDWASVRQKAEPCK